MTNRIWCGGARSLKVYNHKHHIGRIHQIYFIWFLGAGVVFCVPHQCRLRRRHYYMGKSIRSHNNLQWLMVLDNWHLIAVGYVQFYLWILLAVCAHIVIFFHLVLHRLVSFSFARQISKCMRYCTICCSSVPICHLLLTAELCLFFIPQERSLSYFFSISWSVVCVSHVYFTKCYVCFV